MASLYDLPNVGDDYQSLARIAQPQMMPNAPIGAGGMAGQMYYQDKSRQDQYIQQAAKLAELNANMKAQAADEYSAGAPGRMADISVGNAMAQGKQGQLPTLLNTQEEQTKGANAKASSERYAAERQKLYRYANEWNSSQSDDEKEDVRAKMIKEGMDKIGTRNTADVPLDKIDAVMKGLNMEQVNTPAQQQKVQIENSKEATILARERLRGQYGNEKAQIYSNARIEAQKMKQYADSLKPQSKTQWEASMRDKMAKGQMSEGEQAAWHSYIDDQLEVARARAANQPPTINPDIVNEPGQTPILKPAVQPKGGVIPPQPNAPYTTKDGYQVVGKGATAKSVKDKDGSIQEVLGYNPTSKEYFLKNGKTISAE